jgi:hypothetical protein
VNPHGFMTLLSFDGIQFRACHFRHCPGAAGALPVEMTSDIRTVSLYPIGIISSPFMLGFQ